MNTSTDEELVRAVAAGDLQSFGVLVARWERPLLRFVHRLLPRGEDAGDVCQETFLRVMRKAHRFRDGSRFSTWMYQIALNLCRDQARRRQRWRLVVRGGLNTSVEEPASPNDGPAEIVEREAEAVAVREALERIPAEQREVLILKEYEGLKFREIAELLNCPESTVKSRLYYGLTGLRQVLAEMGISRS